LIDHALTAHDEPVHSNEDSNAVNLWLAGRSACRPLNANDADATLDV
jgi:hypothetical protein